MRNLKRVLSLVLASIMLVGMMVVGASAVDTYNDFNDKDEIVNKDAVSLLVTLNVINGKEDGSHFDPTGNVTRAEMAKMISVILNRGADINSQYATLNNGLTDVANNWAVGHINYCYSLDIIAGRGDGKFDPTANVTAVEAAKMLLSAAGYDASIEGMVGPNWDTNTAGLASRLGIFDNFEKDITLSLNRDDAALLIYNFLDIEMIQSYENGYAIAFADSRTVLSFAYGVIKVQGVVVANEWATVNSPDGDDALRAGMTTIWNGDGIFSTTTNTQTNGGNDGLTAAERALRTGTFKVSTPEDYLGKSVTIYIRKTTILADSAVYGQPVLTDDNIVIETGAQVKEGERTVSGTLKKLLSENNLTLSTKKDESTLYFHNYDEYLPTDKVFTDEDQMNSLYNAKGATLTIIDNNGDGVVDFVLSKEKTLSQVSSYSERNESMNIRGIPGSLDFKELVGHEDMEKDDILFYVQYGGRTYVEAPKTITGEMELYNVRGDEKYIKVEGEKYEEDDLKVAANTDPSKFYVIGCEKFTTPDGKTEGTDAEKTLKGVEFDSTYEFFLDDYNNITAFRLVEGTPAKYALVLNSAFSTNGLKTTADLELLLADGTKSTYALDWDASVKNIRSALNDSKDINGDPIPAPAKYPDGTTPTASAYDSVKGEWSSSGAAEYLKKLVGSDDGRWVTGSGTGNREPDYPLAGAFKGNLITYTLNENNVATVGLPVLTEGQRVVDGEVVTKQAPPAVNHSLISSELEKGDVDIYVDHDGQANGVTAFDNINDYGIDADTVIFYYNDDGTGAVRIGYDEMARSVKAGDAVSLVAKKGDTDVAAAILIYPTEKVKFGTDNYVFVMREYNKVGSEYRFNVVDKEGNVTEVKAKSSAKDVADALNDLNTGKTDPKMNSHREGLLYIMNTDGDYVTFSKPKEYNAADHTVVYGVVRFEKDSSRYVNIYPNYKVVGDDKDTVEITDESVYLRLPVRSLDNVFDVDTLRVTDDKAVTTKLDNGMLVAIAYDKDGNNRTIIGAYVEEFYKMDVDDTPAPAPIVEGVFVDLSDPTDVEVYHTAATISDDEALAAIESALLKADGITGIGNKSVNSNGDYVFTVTTKSGFDKTYVYQGTETQVYTGKINNVDVFVPLASGNEFINTAQKQSDCSTLTVTGTYAYGKLDSDDTADYYETTRTDAITGNGFELETGYYKVTAGTDALNDGTNDVLTVAWTIGGKAVDSGDDAYVKTGAAIKATLTPTADYPNTNAAGATNSKTDEITAELPTGTPDTGATFSGMTAAQGTAADGVLTMGDNQSTANMIITVTFTAVGNADCAPEVTFTKAN